MDVLRDYVNQILSGSEVSPNYEHRLMPLLYLPQARRNS